MALNYYWHYPKWVQKTIDRLFPKRDTLSLALRRDVSGVWTFSKFPIVRESICGGSELVLDLLFEQQYGRKPEPEDRVRATVSSKEPPSYTTRIDYMGPDDLMDGASYYNDTTTNKSVWLCPVLLTLMGKPPAHLYLTLD
jgi:hypothetical protein